MSRRRKSDRTRPRGQQAAPGDPETFGRSWLQPAIVVLVAAKVAGVILIFDPASALAFEVPKSIFSLGTAAMLTGLVALALLGHGPGIVPRTRLHLLVGAFALANLLALAFASDRYTALFGGQRRLGLTFVLDMLVLYGAVAIAFRTLRDWTILGAAVVAAGFATIGYGAVQALGLDPIPWADDVRVRPPTTFGNPDKVGHFLGASLAAALAVATLPGPDRSARIRVLAGLYAASALGLAVVVATRGTLLGLAAALPVLAALHLRASRGVAGTRLALTAAGALLVVAALGSALVLATPLGERVRAGFGDAASQQRVFIVQAGLRAAADRPLTGHGPDSFGVLYPTYRPPRASPFVGQDSAHSAPLQALVTTGLPGALSLGGIALASLFLLWRAGAVHPAAATLLVAATAYWAHGLVAIGSVSVDWLGWVAAGGAASFGRRATVRAARSIPAFVQILVIGLSVAVAVSGYSAFQAGRELKNARAAGATDRAIRSAERAISLDSGRAEHWFALGRAHQARDRQASAARALRAATDRAPYVSGYWSALALALGNAALAGDQSLGGKDAALAAARRAIAAEPSFPTAHHIFSLVARTFGDPAAALDASLEAIRLHRGEPEYDAAAAEAALRMTDVTAGRSGLERIIALKDSAVLRVALARVSIKLQDAAAARAHVRRALELEPQNAAARELLTQLGP